MKKIAQAVIKHIIELTTSAGIVAFVSSRSKVEMSRAAKLDAKKPIRFHNPLLRIIC